MFRGNWSSGAADGNDGCTPWRPRNSWPKVEPGPDSARPFGFPRFAWLKILKKSARICTRPVSLRRGSRNDREREESTFQKPGPTRLLRPKLPSTPRGGLQKEE